MMSEDQVNNTIQRWRDTSETDLKPDDFQQFRSLGCACVAAGDHAKLLTFVRDDDNQGMVKSMGCVLLKSLVDEVVKKEKGRDHCQAAITHLTQTCRPEELLQSLLGLTNDIDAGSISETIIALVPHFQTVLQRLDEGKAACVGQVLSALQRQLSRLPVPYTQQQEEADELGLCRGCRALADLTRSLTREVKVEGMSEEEEEELRMELLKFCLKSLREPLLDAQLVRDRKSSLWLFATEIMVTLTAIQASPCDLLFFSSARRSPLQDLGQSKEARACLAYLLFVQLITMDSFPAVFSPVFVLQCNMEYISQLLSSKKESYLLKGLALFKNNLENVQDDCLPVSLLELKSFCGATQKLQKILTDCPLRHLRKSGLRVLQLFIGKLDSEAKHKLFRCMLKTSKHPGLESLVVKNIKNQVEFSMKPGAATKWFLQEELVPLLALVLCLPQGAETDLLHNMDRIMESLNLLRFLLIRDKELRSNTYVWEETTRIKDEYLQTLRVCIGMSRAYYSAELKALTDDRKLKAKEAREAARSSRVVKRITVKHEDVSKMSPEVQNQVLQSALVTFDLMESLIFRIEEITEEKRKKN